MPRNTREWSKRELDAADNNMSWAYSHLQKVIEVYKPEHPEISEPLEKICTLLIELAKTTHAVKHSY